MELKYTTTVEKTYAAGMQKISNTIQGGSDEKYERETNYNPATSLANNFNVKDCQTFTIELPNGNTLNIDILQYVKSNFGDINFIQVSCFESTEENKIPIRFKVTIKVNGNTTNFELGKMSILALGNIHDNKIEKIFLNDILLPAKKSGLLVVTIGTKNDNK